MSRFFLVALTVCLSGVVAPRAAAQADKYALDGDRRHFSLIEWDAPVRSEERNPDEFEAYNDTLMHARLFTTAELLAHASRDVTFRDLVRPAAKDFQFKLIAMDGRLKRVRRIEPTKALAALGVANLYECWIFPTNGTDPLCLLTLDLPDGVEPTMAFNPTRSVQFAGYFFKLIQYSRPRPTRRPRTGTSSAGHRSSSAAASRRPRWRRGTGPTRGARASCPGCWRSWAGSGPSPSG